MSIELLLEPHSDQTSSFIFDEVPLLIRTRFNSTDYNWRIDIQDVEGNPIVSGLTLLPTQDLTGRYAEAALPEGRFMVDGTLSEDRTLNLDSLGNTLKVYYITEQELIDNGL